MIAVAGRSNGLGPVLSGNSTLPVINCPPVKAEDIGHDIWSSLKVPSGKFFILFVKMKCLSLYSLFLIVKLRMIYYINYFILRMSITLNVLIYNFCFVK